LMPRADALSVSKLTPLLFVHFLGIVLTSH